MSVHAISWALKTRTGSPATKAVLLALANYADERGCCWPTQVRIAEETELSVRTVMRALVDLEAHGLIDREERERREDKTRRSDLIRLKMDHGATVSPCQAKVTESHHDLPDTVSPTNLTLCPNLPDTVSGSYNAGTVIEPSVEPSGPIGPSRVRAPTATSSIPKASSAGRGSRLPSDWRPSRADIEFAEREGVTGPWLDREIGSFLDFWHGKPGERGRKVDWSATWRNWVRKAVDRGEPRSRAGPGRARNAYADVHDYYTRMGEQSDEQTPPGTVEIFPPANSVPRDRGPARQDDEPPRGDAHWRQ